MNRQTKREIKRELLLFGSSVFKAAVFCGFVFALAWSIVTLLAMFQIINVTG
tara:strand:- start:2 stop:157 length:156 start_codon:yes stop_codon:yes gene_type:complete